MSHNDCTVVVAAVAEAVVVVEGANHARVMVAIGAGTNMATQMLFVEC